MAPRSARVDPIGGTLVAAFVFDAPSQRVILFEETGPDRLPPLTLDTVDTRLASFDIGGMRVTLIAEGFTPAEWERLNRSLPP
ncbi:MAG: hypothetical protein HY608_11695 [Planctomycetes bacterium]|nr:hypothetical protein [Planctomycetota bacterium]